MFCPCPCFEKKEEEELMLKRKMMAELLENAPVKDELVTHDGVVYFPKELMPPEPEENVQYSARLGFKGNAASSFLLKSRHLNLKLKIKKPNNKATNPNAPTILPLQRNSMQFGHQIKNHKINPKIMNLNMNSLKTQERFEKQEGQGYQTQRINQVAPDTPENNQKPLNLDDNDENQTINNAQQQQAEQNSDYIEQQN